MEMRCCSLIATFCFVIFNHCRCDIPSMSPPTGNQLFAAVAHMEPLVELESRLLTVAKDYLDQERTKLNNLRQFAESVKKATALSKDDPVRYIGNPVNAYLIIKRFTSGWKQLSELLSVDDSKLSEVKRILDLNSYVLPNEREDLVGAIAALFRLQDTYLVTAREISDGEINGVKKSAHQLTVHDCLEIVHLAHNSRRYMRMYDWMQEATRIMNDPNLAHRRANVSQQKFHEYAAWTEYLNNNMTGALWHTEKVLALDPTNNSSLQNKKIYSWYVESKKPCLEPQCQYVAEATMLTNKNIIYNHYNNACRGFPVKNIRDVNNLVCYYKQDRPRLILKPVKVTRVHDDPEVLVFHNVLTDGEIKKLKRTATPQLKPAEVIDWNTHEIKTADYRVAKSMWLNKLTQKNIDLADALDRKSEDITGLNAKYAEEYQIQNYGLGGQYEFHIDHGTPGTVLANHPYGNRIATLLFYFTDVERGGATVFTKIGLMSHPKKGDATFWYNLFRNGTGNPITEHAGCPVLSGSKWVMNKWFRMAGNEFTRPCKLSQDE